MKKMLERFLLNIRHLDKNLPYLAGISGGRDSMVLLHLLDAAGFQDVTLCHLNHGTRKTAQRDQNFVENIAFVSEKRIICDTITCLQGSQTTENGLRTHRMEFFGHAQASTQAAGIFLGHHADDQAETFLWNLLRGSGSAGLSGMQTDNHYATSSGPIRLLRPMLEFWREEIDAYAAEHHIEFVEDPSNRFRKYTRNRLRHDILPWLEGKLGRNIRQNLHRTASILSEENLVLEKLLPALDWAAPLSVAALLPQPIALQRRIILHWLQHHAVAEAGFAEVELIRSLLDVTTGPARINLPENRQARRRAGKITLAHQSD